MTIRFAAPLVAALLALPAAAQSDLANLSPEERAAFGAEVRAYLLENPEVIFEAIQILEERRAQMAEAADGELVAEHAEALFDDGYSYVGGNPEGDVTVVEFLDYRCGYCKRAHPEVKAALEADDGIRYVVKEFPILGPQSLEAGRIALAALEVDREKYAALNDRLMSHQGSMTEAAAYRIAANVGYDIAALKDAVQDGAIEEKLKKTYALAETLGIEGTPSFVVGDRIIRGYVPKDEILAAVRSARQTAAN